MEEFVHYLLVSTTFMSFAMILMSGSIVIFQLNCSLLIFIKAAGFAGPYFFQQQVPNYFTDNLHRIQVP